MARASAKTEWMKRARAVAKKIDRYAAFGFITSVDDFRKDDAAILRALDRLYDTQRAAGLASDEELTAYRADLRTRYVTARNVTAPASRASYYEGKAAASHAESAAGRAGLKGYLDELKIARAKGKL